MLSSLFPKLKALQGWGWQERASIESKPWGPNLEPSSLKIVSASSALLVHQSAYHKGHRLMSNMNFCALQIFRNWFPACLSLIKEGKACDHEPVSSY
jgi:hypothetical protein